MSSERWAAIAFVASGLMAILASLLFRTDGPARKNPWGMLLFFVGMLFFLWCVSHLRAAFFGKIEPATDTLVKTGPYRLLRHPLYLGMIVMMLGISLSLGSSWGIVATLLLFVPAVVYRATLEEGALERRGGAQWRKYKEGTFFMLPGLK